MTFEIMELKTETEKFVILDNVTEKFLEWYDINIPVKGSIRVNKREEAQAIIDFLNGKFKRFKDFAGRIKKNLPENILKELNSI